MKIINLFFNNYKKILPIITIFIFFGIYLRTLSFGFINDDFNLIRPTISQAFNRILDGEHFRPLWYLSFPIVNYFFGPNALVHHLFSLVLHLINLYLAYSIFEKILNQEKALLIIFFWTLLPQLSFQIAWISGKNDLLMTFFLLLSFKLAINNKMEISLIAYLFAFLSKVTCLFYPLIYFTKFGFGYSKRTKIISLLLFLFIFLTSYLALRNGTLQPHISELSFSLRILNHIKNFITGWILLFFPIPFFFNFFIGAIYIIFICTIFFVILRSFKIHKFSLLLTIICFVLSITLSINYSLRITYTLSLFVVATLISFIDVKRLNYLHYNKFLKIIIFSFFLIYGVTTSTLVTNKFKSNQFDIWGEKYIMNDYYLNDFYGKFRIFQIKFLKDNHIK